MQQLALHYLEKDTKAAISDLQIPEVYAQVICRQVGLTVTVD